MKRLLCPFVLAALGACAHAPAPVDATEAVRPEIERQLAVFADAMKRKDVDAAASIFDEDGFYVVSGATVRGRAAIREQLLHNLQGRSIESLAIRTDQVGVSGDLAWEVGTNAVSFILDDGQRKSFIGRYSSVWKRQADDHWRLKVDSPIRDPVP